MPSRQPSERGADLVTHTCQQGTAKWLQLRAGLPTASEMDSIITPSGKPSTSAERYLHELLAERIMQRPRASAVTLWMKRGSVLEKQARSYYEFTRGVEVKEVGFITDDSNRYGCSPDGLVDEDGTLEIKCPSDHIHVAYLLAKAGKSVDKAYRVQTQAILWVTERKFVDIVSFHPDMPEALFRIERDEDFIGKLSTEVLKFSAMLEDMTAQLMEIGLIKPKSQPVDVYDDQEQFINSSNGFITQEDAEFILRKHFPQMYSQSESSL